jgi:hypothetical protein
MRTALYCLPMDTIELIFKLPKVSLRVQFWNTGYTIWLSFHRNSGKSMRQIMEEPMLTAVEQKNENGGLEGFDVDEGSSKSPFQLFACH